MLLAYGFLRNVIAVFEKYKTSIDDDQSFYNTEYWKELIKKHPLPSLIHKQLINTNENKNSY